MCDSGLWAFISTAKLFFSDSQIDTWTQMDRPHSLHSSTDNDKESLNVTKLHWY